MPNNLVFFKILKRLSHGQPFLLPLKEGSVYFPVKKVSYTLINIITILRQMFLSQSERKMNKTFILVSCHTNNDALRLLAPRSSSSQ